MITRLRDYSRAVGVEPVLIHPSFYPMVAVGTPQSIGGLVSLRIRNVGAVTVWLSRTGEAAVGAPGSYPLRPEGIEESAEPHIPMEALWAVAEATGGALTVELRYLPRVFTTGAEA